jgi:hypothetical protein
MSWLSSAVNFVGKNILGLGQREKNSRSLVEQLSPVFDTVLQMYGRNKANRENISYQREANEATIASQENANLANIAFQERVNASNIAAQERIARQYQDFTRSETDRIAQYNSPVNQVIRLKEAGLNPMLAMAGAANMGGMSMQSYNGPGPAVSKASVSKGAVSRAARVENIIPDDAYTNGIFQLAKIANVKEQNANIRQQNVNLRHQDSLLSSQKNYYDEKERSVALQNQVRAHDFRIYKKRNLASTDRLDKWTLGGQSLFDLKDWFLGHLKNSPTKPTNTIASEVHKRNPYIKFKNWLTRKR